jgi:putative inorganic carbon (HCO3(-)) transporter
VFASDVVSRIQNTVANFQNGQIENRVHFWKTYLAMIADRPLVGQGAYWIETGLREAYYDRLGFASLNEKFNAHNIYLESMANIGIVGALLACALLWGIFKVLGNFASQATAFEPRLLFRALGAGLFANLLHAFTQNVFFDSNVLIPFLALFWVCFWLSVANAEFAPPEAVAAEPK